MKYRIVILDGITTNPGDLSWDSLKEHGDLTVHVRTKQEELIERAVEADILVTNKLKIDAATIDHQNRARPLPYVPYSFCEIGPGL